MQEERIEQLGETIASSRKPFEILPAFHQLRA
jgi:hypothetical protein